MANKYIGHAFFTLKKMAACENFTLLKALQYAFFTRHVCIMHVENEPMLNIGKRAFRMLVKSYPWKHKRVDIMFLIRHTLYLAENKQVTGGKNHGFKTGWIHKISSHIYVLYAQYCAPISHLPALFRAYIPFIKQGSYGYV